jgi:TPR repeat protein
VDAITMLGLFLNEEQKYEEANAYHKRATELGDPFGMHNLGNAYFYGRGMTPDGEKAFLLWEQAAHLGNVDSMTTLGKCYRDGKIVKRDIDKSIFYLNEAAKRGHVPAIEILIEVYKSQGDTKNSRYWQDILEQPAN